MKNVLSFSLKLFSIFFLTSLFSSCIKDTCRQVHHYTYYEPLYKTSAEVRSNIKSNPAKEIKNPGKILILGNYIFLNEVDKGIHVIDNRNPSSPVNVAFIDIPGNIDLAVKGNTLYADLYTDLVTLDISNPLNVVKKTIVDGVFPERYYEGAIINDSSKIIYDWIKHDTTIYGDCKNNMWTQGGVVVYTDFGTPALNSNGSKSPIGIAGSMARFALVNNYLYTVSNSDLNIFNISNAMSPAFSNKVQVDWHVETIYPFENKLFIGSNNGMYMYDINSSPDNPVKLGEFTHARSCDPVIADDKYAFVTLHSGTTCLGFNNELDVIQLNNLVNPSLLKVYSLTSPHGLSKDGNLLFICDGEDGLKIFNASNVQALQLIKHFSNLETYDVIANNNVALVVASDGLYQYNYADVNNIHLISKINIFKN